MHGPREMSAGRPFRDPRAVAWTAAILAYAALLLFASGSEFVRALERTGGGSASGWDKVLHMAAFAVLGALLFRLLRVMMPRTPVWRGLPLAFAAGLLYAGFHEGLQILIPSFTFNPLDFLADAVGLASALILLGLLRRRSDRPRATGEGPG